MNHCLCSIVAVLEMGQSCVGNWVNSGAASTREIQLGIERIPNGIQYGRFRRVSLPNLTEDVSLREVPFQLADVTEVPDLQLSNFRRPVSPSHSRSWKEQLRSVDATQPR